MGALVVLLICAADVPRDQCTESNARVYISTRIEQPVCGLFVMEPPPGVGMKENEFARVRCTR